ncbi:hypothetical protein OHR68_42875 [Spirillospora sp. NBC_00431]
MNDAGPSAASALAMPSAGASAQVFGGSSGVAPDVRELLGGLTTSPWGQVAPSVYETGRVVSHAPWLTGHERRVAYLLETQRSDGGWGAPDDGYALVPTLSATEALLSALDRGDSRAPVADAAVRGLRRLGHWLPGVGGRLPDMPAIELIVPSLIERINERIAASPAPAGRPEATPLPLPHGVDGGKLDLMRKLLRSGLPPWTKLMHALETGGDAARGLAPAGPETGGPPAAIGASPAATAAWLGDRPPDDPSTPARWYLETVAAAHDGLLPVTFPLTVFERGWVIGWLARAGVPFSAPPHLVLSLTAPLGARGTAAADGLPADADTTAGALYALAHLGAAHSPEPLLQYETATHFCTWQGEEGFSTTTNAHALEAFGEYLRTVPAERIADDTAHRYKARMRKAESWLIGQQRDDGSWADRWHASPYYATTCCVLALRSFGRDPRTAAALERARHWVLGTQRPDGSWGRWQGTAEETAYAVLTLLLGAERPERPNAEAVRAAARGRAALGRADGTALWHDKDLYHPRAIVRAAVLAARYLLGAAGHSAE